MAELAHHNLEVDTAVDWTETLTWRRDGSLINLTGWAAVAEARLATDAPALVTFNVANGGAAGTTILSATKEQLAPLAGRRAVWGITLTPPGAGEALVMEGFVHFQARVGAL